MFFFLCHFTDSQLSLVARGHPLYIFLLSSLSLSLFQSREYKTAIRMACGIGSGDMKFIMKERLRETGKKKKSRGPYIRPNYIQKAYILIPPPPPTLPSPEIYTSTHSTNTPTSHVLGHPSNSPFSYFHTQISHPVSSGPTTNERA